MKNADAIKIQCSERREGIARSILKKQAAALSVLLVMGAAGCGTLTGATLGGAAGAGIGAGTHSNVGRSAAIGAGVGGTAGALYDLYNYNRHDHYRDYED